MTVDQALARLAAARLRLFNASQRREAAVLRRARVDSAKAFDDLNVAIATARGDVSDAIDAVQAAIAATPPDPTPPPPPPPDPVQVERDAALDAVIAARDAVSKL